MQIAINRSEAADSVFCKCQRGRVVGQASIYPYNAHCTMLPDTSPKFRGQLPLQKRILGPWIRRNPSHTPISDGFRSRPSLKKNDIDGRCSGCRGVLWGCLRYR